MNKLKLTTFLLLSLILTACSSGNISASEAIDTFIKDSDETLLASTTLLSENYDGIVSQKSFEGLVMRVSNRTKYEIVDEYKNTNDYTIKLKATTYDFESLFNKLKSTDEIIKHIDNNDAVLEVEGAINVPIKNKEKLDLSENNKVEIMNLFFGEIRELTLPIDEDVNDVLEEPNKDKNDLITLADPVVSNKSETTITSKADPVKMSEIATWQNEETKIKLRLNYQGSKDKETVRIINQHEYNQDPIPGFQLTELNIKVKHVSGKEVKIVPTDFKVYDENFNYVPSYINYNSFKEAIISEENKDFDGKVTLQYPASTEKIYITFKDHEKEFIIFEKSI